uniref:39S ribosomal protein L35, mitochondrial-like n=1 Tax=Phallusia mammillata TaxID=59560 RepID=A0A6F9DKK1_9ASCI|nr:39S ribosomal protein L35, mitochondrial-like [Phallusia mammillata]
MLTVLQNLPGRVTRSLQPCVRCLSCLTTQRKSELPKSFQKFRVLPQQNQTLPFSSFSTPLATNYNIGAPSSTGGLVSVHQSPLSLLKSPNAFPKVSQIPIRTLMNYEEYVANRKRAADSIINRFRRLGNGLWLRRQQSSNHKIWLKIIKHKGPSKVYRQKQNIICNGQQSRKMDSLVPRQWKRQKWYVDDPYKGYTEESLFHYHPMDLPWNKSKTDESEINRNYGWRRTQRGNRNRIARKFAHKDPSGSHRRKPFSISQPSGLYH